MPFLFIQVLLGSSEFLKEVHGTIGSLPANIVITSLTFVTNYGCYGPFGREEGTPFRATTQGNGSIVGFFVRAGSDIEAIGVYADHDHETINVQGDMVLVIYFTLYSLAHTLLYNIRGYLILPFFPDRLAFPNLGCGVAVEDGLTTLKWNPTVWKV